MTCRRIEKQIPLAAGGDLDREELAVVETHCAGCLPCYRELSRFRAALAPLRQLREAGQLPRDLLCDVLSAVDAARDSGVRPAPIPTALPMFARLRFVTAAAVVFLGVIVGSELAEHAESSGVPGPGAGIATYTGSPFERIANTQLVSYPLRRDVFGGASPVLLPAAALGDLAPADDYYPRIRRSQPSPAVLRVSAQADDF